MALSLDWIFSDNCQGLFYGLFKCVRMKCVFLSLRQCAPVCRETLIVLTYVLQDVLIITALALTKICVSPCCIALCFIESEVSAVTGMFLSPRHQIPPSVTALSV